MKSITLSSVPDHASLGVEVAEALARGELVCVPCGGRYRLLADLYNEEAVLHLLQAKSRTATQPALVLVPDEQHLARVGTGVDALALRIARRVWPAPLTLRVEPHPDLPRGLVKLLGGSKAKVGVRVPADPLARQIVKAFGRPVLASSANRQKRTGDTSPAGVRRTFAQRMDLFLDAGELAPEPPSTVIEVEGGRVLVHRAGAVPESVWADVVPAA